MAAARVIFVPTDPTGKQQAATAISDASGKYTLTTYSAGDGAQADDYRIKVTWYKVRKPTPEEQAQHVKSLEEEQKVVYPPSDRPVPPAKNLLPKKYESETTSGITCTVTKGRNTLDIKID